MNDQPGDVDPTPTPDPAIAPDRHCAFLSYRWADNEQPAQQWCDWIKDQLRAFVIPAAIRESSRILDRGVYTNFERIYQDQEKNAPGPDLMRHLRGELDRSDFLIVICSPRAAASKIIPKEIEHFARKNPGERIIPVYVDGELPAARPAPLRDKEKIYVDLRPQRMAREGFTDLKAYEADLRHEENKKRPGDRRSEEAINELVKEYEAQLKDGIVQIAAALLRTTPAALRLALHREEEAAARRASEEAARQLKESQEQEEAERKRAERNEKDMLAAQRTADLASAKVTEANQRAKDAKDAEEKAAEREKSAREEIGRLKGWTVAALLAALFGLASAATGYALYRSVDGLRTEKARLEEQTKNLGEKIADLTDRNGKLDTKNQTLVTHNGTLTTENSTLRGTKETLEGEKKNLEETNKQLGKTQGDLKTEIATREIEKKNLDETNKQLGKTQGDLKTEIATRDIEKKNLEDKIKALQGNLATMTDDHKNLGMLIADLTKKKGELEKTIGTLEKDTLVGLQKQKTDLQAEIEVLKKQRAELQKPPPLPPAPAPAPATAAP